MTIVGSGFVAWYATPNALRQRRVNKSKKARLQAKLAQHQIDQKDPSRLLVEVVFGIVFYVVLLASAYPVALLIAVVDSYLVSIVPETAPSKSLWFTLISYLFSCLGLLFVFVPPLKRLFYFRFPDFRMTRLQRRIRKIEDDESLLP